LIEPGASAPDSLRLERIADAIVSIEYYMETLPERPHGSVVHARQCRNLSQGAFGARMPRPRSRTWG